MTALCTKVHRAVKMSVSLYFVFLLLTSYITVFLLFVLRLSVLE